MRLPREADVPAIALAPQIHFLLKFRRICKCGFAERRFTNFEGIKVSGRVYVERR